MSTGSLRQTRSSVSIAVQFWSRVRGGRSGSREGGTRRFGTSFSHTVPLLVLRVYCVVVSGSIPTQTRPCTYVQTHVYTGGDDLLTEFKTSVVVPVGLDLWLYVPVSSDEGLVTWYVPS